MGIRRASARTASNFSTAAAAAATPNLIRIAPATATQVAGGGSIGAGAIQSLGVTITNVAVASDNTFTTVLDDAAVSTAGGFIRLIGTGFTANSQVYFNNALISNVVVSSTQINATIPPTAAGPATLYVFNENGNGAIWASGMPVSGFPTWVQSSYLSTLTLSVQLLAVGDGPLTYSLQPGSNLPAGASLSSSGLISGTVSAPGVFLFTVLVNDAQNQTTQQNITLTINVIDPQFNQTALLLIGNGTNGAQNNTFIDSSVNNFTMTRAGNATQGTFSPFSQNGWSVFMDGTGDSVSIPANAALTLASSDFTIEFWINAPTQTNTFMLDLRGGASSGYPHVTTGTSSAVLRWGSTGLSGNTVICDNRWHHCAITRQSNTLRFFVDGILDASSTDSTNYSISRDLAIGNNSYGGGNFTGFLSNYRIIKGTALYTSNFTPSVIPLTAVTNTSLLIFQDNRLIDKSTNNFVATSSGDTRIQAFGPFASSSPYSTTTVGGSAYFDGTSDSVTAPVSAALNLTGNFTIEFWAYPTASIVNGAVAGSPNSSLRFDSGGFLYLFNTGTVFINSSSGNYLPLNTWSHVAITRSGSTIRFFRNGIETPIAITGSAATATYAFSNISIGLSTNTFGGTFTGYISNFRIVNGTALYTTAFSPPTTPLTAIANTQLLLNFTNGGIIDNTSKNAIETINGASITTSVSKFGSGSIAFDGNLDALFVPPSPNYGYGTGDFTIEFWLRLNSVVSQTIVSHLTAVGSTAPHIYLASGGSIRYFTASADRITGDVLSTGQWYHVALCRSSGNTRMFINGTQTGSTYNDSNNYGILNPLIVGDYGIPLTGASTLNGFIDDLRITRGFARYTANFAPPADQLPIQ